MSKVIGILLVVGALWGLWSLREYYNSQKQANPDAYDYDNRGPKGPVEFDPRTLSGLHYSLETPLASAKRSGADGLKKFLTKYRAAIRDPRLAWIQLDYVVLAGSKDPAAARAVFAEVKRRNPTNSHVNSRMQKLSKVYE